MACYQEVKCAYCFYTVPMLHWRWRRSLSVYIAIDGCPVKLTAHSEAYATKHVYKLNFCNTSE